jgi:hypothetical protein
MSDIMVNEWYMGVGVLGCWGVGVLGCWGYYIVFCIILYKNNLMSFNIIVDEIFS